MVTRVLKRVISAEALAAGQSERDQPVCSECLKQVVAEVERLVEQAGMAFFHGL